MEKTRFENKTAIVTGGSRGIGAAAARRLSAEGAEVFLFAGNMEKMLSVLDEMKNAAGSDADPALYDESHALKVDVSKEEQVKAAVEKVVSKSGKIDLLVNMAGIAGPSARIEDYPGEDMRRIFEINVFGTFYMVKYCLPYMQENGFGSIVNACSCSGMRGYPMESAYGASKGAILQFTRTTGAENGSNGIRSNCISPGWVDTDMFREELKQYGEIGMPDTIEELDDYGTMDRPSTADEMVSCILFLLSDEASYVNGSNLVCDGGMTIV